MARIERFEEYNIWKEARILCNEIFEVTRREAFSKDFELRNQIRKSSGSVMDNIAEGHDRGGNKEFVNFLGIARGSCGEVKSQLYRARDRAYINQEEFHRMYNRGNKISGGITNLMKYLKNAEDKGFKFH